MQLTKTAGFIFTLHLGAVYAATLPISSEMGGVAAVSSEVHQAIETPGLERRALAEQSDILIKRVDWKDWFEEHWEAASFLILLSSLKEKDTSFPDEGKANYNEKLYELYDQIEEKYPGWKKGGDTLREKFKKELKASDGYALPSSDIIGQAREAVGDISGPAKKKLEKELDESAFQLFGLKHS
ncbi:hypothetical protein F4810DRAFT_710063 [Camillea tinctor]|nr:hypothetical protein F4810DRAFT_710063 [Camillea tinctor]